MPFRDALRYLVALAGLAALGAACYRSACLAWADYLYRLDNEAPVAEAARLVPESGEYHARLAALMDDAGREPARVEAELRQAVAADPRLASAWSELGLRAEAGGRQGEAEILLERAAGLDHAYSTLWTLANFYFRHNESDKFWAVARRALRTGDVATYDPAPLFRLCWKVSRDPAAVERAIPGSGPVQARYLDFLVRQNLTAVAAPVAVRVAAFGGDEDQHAVLDYCDQRIAAGDVNGAVHAWNALCRRAFPGYPPLEAETAALTNGNFSSTPMGHGFDWRTPAVAGVTVERGGPPPRLRIAFDGHETDRCDVLEQYLALSPSRTYRLRFRYQTDNLPPESGLRWRLRTPAGTEIPSDAADIASERETVAAIRFAAPAGVRLARLALEYHRPPGAVRIEGRITLSAASLAFDP